MLLHSHTTKTGKQVADSDLVHGNDQNITPVGGARHKIWHFALFNLNDGRSISEKGGD